MALDTDSKRNSQPPALSHAWSRLVRPGMQGQNLRMRVAQKWPRGLLPKVVAINIIPLVLFLAALQSFTTYRSNLIETELLLLQKQSQLTSVLVSTTITENRGLTLGSTELADAIGENLPHENGVHIAVSDRAGNLLFDSRAYWSPGRLQRSLPAENFLMAMWEGIQRWSPISYQLTPFPGLSSSLDPTDDDFLTALQGEGRMIAYSDQDNRLVLTSIVPLRLDGLYVGVIEISKSDDRISDAAIRMQMNVARILIMAFFLSLAVSLYLTAFVAHPLRRLSKAAEQVRVAFDDTHIQQVREMSKRRDEIGELAKSFEQMTESLLERLHNSEQFAADVAHELKNPLTSMRSAFETYDLIKDPKKRQALRDIIAHDMERLDRLITDIAKSSRLDAELAREELQPFAIVPFLEDLCATYLPLLQDRKRKEGKGDMAISDPVLLDVQIARNTKVSGHPDRLAQVMLNVIDNALSFSPPGVPVKVTVVSGGLSVRVLVDDSGPGIPDNKLEAIFDRFYSERPPDEDFGTHSGLGLAISRQIIAAHGGKIWAENRKSGSKNLGARFFVQLPTYRGEDQ